MMSPCSTLILFFLLPLNLSNAFFLIDSRKAKSLYVEMVPHDASNGCCSHEFYNAASQELFNFVNDTTTQVFLILGLSLDSIIINAFDPITSSSCRRQRLLRGINEEDEPEGAKMITEAVEKELPDRDVRIHSSNCAACTRKFYSAYCSGCYLCESGRRHRERDLLLLGGLLAGVLDVTTDVLNAAVAAVAFGIVPHFADWLSNGLGAALAEGCMGSPDRLQIFVNLV